MPMIAEVSAENNSITVLVIQSDFVTLSKSLSDYIDERAASTFDGKG